MPTPKASTSNTPADPATSHRLTSDAAFRAALPGWEVRLDAAWAKGAPFCRHIIVRNRAGEPKKKDLGSPGKA